jgi:hypothetical protein
MKQLGRYFGPAFAVAAIVFGTGSVSVAEDTSVQAADCVLSGSALAGMVVHIDPATGRPTSRPLPEQAADIAVLQAAGANRSAAGLVEERGPTGGVRVNLRDRFRSPLVAVRQADGSVHADHVSCQPIADSMSDGGE